MSEPNLFIPTEQALTKAIDQIMSDQWQRQIKIPGWFPLKQSQTNLSLREVINYHAYDTAWAPDVLPGNTIAEGGAKPDASPQDRLLVLAGLDPEAAK